MSWKERLLQMRDLGFTFCMNDGDNIEPWLLIYPIAPQIVIGTLTNFTLLSMVNGLPGSSVIGTEAGFNLHEYNRVLL
jgi:hypothetical protein